MCTTDDTSTPKKKAVILLLDMDGVLADVSMSYRAAIIKTAHFFGGMNINSEMVSTRKAAGGCNNDWVLTRDLLSEEAGIQKTLEEVTEKFEEYYQVLSEDEGLIPDAAFLAELSGRCRSADGGGTAIVTGRPRKDCEKFLERNGLSGLFDACICMEDGPPKPDPFPIVAALEALGAAGRRDRAVMVGDTPDDIRAAVAAGVRAVGVFTPDDHKIGKKLLADAMLECGAEEVMDPGFDKLSEIF
mmetsp:Transcript_10161/g.20406  ORF Transcript_10161/g.20406 Transcript_10161/m.20406 type:complete len:244 (-) Transcript_10161:42-773(-)